MLLEVDGNPMLALRTTEPIHGQLGHLRGFGEPLSSAGSKSRGVGHSIPREPITLPS